MTVHSGRMLRRMFLSIDFDDMCVKIPPGPLRNTKVSIEIGFPQAWPKFSILGISESRCLLVPTL